MKIFILTFILFFNLIAQNSIERNGRWWNKLNSSKKQDYLVGYLDGMDLGVYFLYLNLKDEKLKKSIKNKIINNYNQNKKFYFGNISYNQLVSELNSFYTNPGYEDIKLRGAIYLILLKLTGASDQKLNETLKFFNKIREHK